MGTVHIKNLSKLSDRTAVLLAATFYAGVEPEVTLRRMDRLRVEIKKRGHTFVVINSERDF